MQRNASQPDDDQASNNQKATAFSPHHVKKNPQDEDAFGNISARTSKRSPINQAGTADLGLTASISKPLTNEPHLATPDRHLSREHFHLASSQLQSYSSPLSPSSSMGQMTPISTRTALTSPTASVASPIQPSKAVPSCEPSMMEATSQGKTGNWFANNNEVPEHVSYGISAKSLPRVQPLADVHRSSWTQELDQRGLRPSRKDSGDSVGTASTVASTMRTCTTDAHQGSSYVNLTRPFLINHSHQLSDRRMKGPTWSTRINSQDLGLTGLALVPLDVDRKSDYHVTRYRRSPMTRNVLIGVILSV